MDRTNHSVDAWIAQQIPTGAIVLELCAGNGDRSIRLAQQCDTAYWQLTDRHEGDINQAMGKASGMADVECWIMAAEDWANVHPETSIVIVRNALHVLSPQQIRAICRQTFELRADLIIANCFDLIVQRTAEFQEHVLKTGGFIWPYSYIVSIAQSEGLSPGPCADHWDDEACDLYGKITSVGFRRLGQ
jgi:hypothetical protein